MAARLILGLGALAAALALTACDPPPPPHTFTVNATLDKVDAAPGDGVCQTSTAGECTLRAAVQEANAIAGDDTIVLQASAAYPLTIPLSGEDAAAMGDLDLTSNITIHGNGSIIFGTTSDAAVQVRSATAALDHLSLRGGIGSGLDSVGGTTTLADSTMNGSIGVSVAGGTVTATRSTLSAASTWGASITSGQLTLVDSTVGANGSGGIRKTGGTVTATNSIVGEQTSGPGCSATITSNGYNLDAGTACGFTLGTDLQGVPARLAPLTIDAGATPTMRPMVGSPAVDSGQPGCTGTDQRGAPRPVDGDGAGGPACDRGAVETNAWHPLALTVTSTSDVVDEAPGDGVCHTAVAGDCTLRAAVQESDASTGPDVIDLAASATYQLAIPGAGEDAARSGDLDLTSPVAIHGHGSSIVGGYPPESVLQVFSTGVALDHVGVTGAGGTAIDAQPRAGVSLTDSTAWKTTLGVRAAAGSQISLTRSTLSDSSVGLWSNGGATTVVDSTIAGNTVNIQRVSGTVTTTNSIVADPTGSPSCTAPITSGGWNLSTDSSCGLAGATDLTAAYGHLGPLVTTGTTVPSREPTGGSSAIDTGKPGCSGTDQRGRPRPVDGDGIGGAACDRGAVEVPLWNPHSFVVDSTEDWPDATPGDGLCVATNGACTLRAAVQEANAASGTDVIDLGTDQEYGIGGYASAEDDAAVGDLDLASDVVLHGHGSGISSTLDPATLQVHGATLTADHLSIKSYYDAGIDLRAAGLSLVDTTVEGWTGAVTSIGQAPITAVRSNLGVNPIIGSTPIGITQTGAGALTLTSSAIGSIVSAASQVHLTASTVSGLTVTAGAATVVDSTVVGQHVGIKVQNAGTANLTNSIVDHLDVDGSDCAGSVTSAGWNLTSDHSCALSGPSDLQDSEPRLSTLRFHGGPTRSRIPLGGSPAVDTGKPGCSGVDQRGLARPADGDGNGITGCDRGAVELPTWNPRSLTVTSGADAHDLTPGDGVCQADDGSGCTLRAAIEESTGSTGPDVVTIAVPTVTINIGDPELGTSYPTELSIETDVLVHGGGAAIVQGSLRVLGSTISIDHLAITTVDSTGGDLSLIDSSLIGYDYSTFAGVRTTLLRTTAASEVRIGSTTATVDSSRLDGLLWTSGASTTMVTRSTLASGLKVGDSSSVTVMSSTVTDSLRAIQIDDYSATPAASVTLVDSTVVGGLVSALGWQKGSVTATNSIITAPAGELACAPPAGVHLQSGGWNLVTDSTCGIAGSNDLQGVDAKLAPLIGNGGPTPTFRPDSGSPAIDSGKPGCSGADQRGLARPQDGDGNGSVVCDRGAVELGAYHPLALGVDATSSEPDADPGDGLCRTAAPVHCTLLAAIQESNVSNGPDVVTLAAGATYPLALPAPVDPYVRTVDVTGDLTIQGSGATVQGLGLHAVHGSLKVLDLRLASVAVLADSSTLVIDRSTLAGTSQSVVVKDGSQATISRTTITGMTPGSIAGAISVTASSLTLDNSTISDIDFGIWGQDATIAITSSTIYANTGGFTLNAGSATMANTIIGRPSLLLPSPAACSGPVQPVSLGWNLTWDSSCGLSQPTDLQSSDPKLGPLGLFGGTTPTRLLRPGSPAIDSGQPGCATTDQRGRTRPADGNGDGTAACDRGAVEVQAANPLSLTVSSTADRVDADPGDGVCATTAPVICTLRAAIQESNASTGADTVNLASGGTYALALAGTGEDGSASGDLDISGSVVVHGNGSTLDGGGFESAVQTFTGSVTIDHLTITGVSSVANRSTNTVIVTDTTLAGLAATSGTGFESTGSGQSALVRTTISNRASATSTTSGTGLLTVQTSTITGNLWGLSTGSGGAVVVDSTLVNNPYGALLPSGGKITVTNSIVSSGGSTLCRPGTGSIVSLGWNLASDTSCGFAQTGDVQGVPTLLGPLAMNGWYTATFLPSATSPAVGTGKPGCSGKDQRGLVRPSGGACDKGAVER